MQSQIQRLVSNIFPDTPRLIFAYGSAVFPQSLSKPKKQPMLDLILVVDDPVTFHKQNLNKNYQHYSFLRRLGSKNITQIQDSFGGKLYFNPLIPLTSHDCSFKSLKYGIMSTHNFVDDLENWSTFYIAGRLQKPVLFLSDVDNTIRTLLQKNKEAALAAALLMSMQEQREGKISVDALLCKIIGLSYMRDIRMAFAENPSKVQNIYQNNKAAFLDMYIPVIKEQSKLINNCIELSKVSEKSLIERLPKPLREEVFNTGNPGALLAKSLGSRIFYSSTQQTVKGFFTSGILKSYAYAADKVGKRIFK